MEHVDYVRWYVFYACRFRLGRQEDAHEYLIALLDAMHDRSIAGMNPKPSRELEYTSFIYQIFGGKIRSQLKCTQCDYESNTYDPFLDLSLEITRAHSVQKALQRFTTGEVLDGQNSYKCPKQNTMVRAIKRITIEDAPNILIIQLKRFEFSRSGRKISKHVDFDQTLDLSPYMSQGQKKGSAIYELYGVLVHQGYSMHSGHYYCFLKGTGGGEWHKFDDSSVHATSARNAMGQSPYILFYTKKITSPPKRLHSHIGKENVPKSLSLNAGKNKTEYALRTPVRRTMPKAIDKSFKALDENKDKEKKSSMRGSRPSASRVSKKHITRPLSLTPLARSKLQQGGTILLPRTRLRSAQKQTPNTSIKSSADESKKSLFSSQKSSTTVGDHESVASQTPSSNKKRKSLETRGSRKKQIIEDMHTHSSKTRKQGTEALRKFKSNSVGMGLDTWDSIDSGIKKQRDRNMRKTVVPRKKLDTYDAEYDKGKTKKVKDKSKSSGAYLTSAAYDAVAKQLSKAKRLFRKQ